MINNNNIEEWCKKCGLNEEDTPATCKICKNNEASVIRFFGAPVKYTPKNDCEHEGLEVVIIDLDVCDNDNSVIITRQDICIDCGENVGEQHHQTYTLVG